ncbi:FimV family protein [Crenothrix polyspora]|uniref:LysM domain-containing protein n=1 Tax=Crenothrix polyspora TaxID=360316 RepID=A0A1R4HC50_9GAMM|nr:FimV/HubP family polar landmark protein [Crenothrix polyspora]SJM93834.1 exported hypothetical protein [Crenothrix polyspora]
MSGQSKKAIMVRFIKATGICLLLAHNSAQALNIGNIRVKSALNQSFNADIMLSLNTGDNAGDIHVQLAPYDKFSEQGVPWDRELLKLHFNTVQSTGNSVLIRVKSSGVISEPVLVFLLQASSRKGTIYRQFTVLLDPPANYESVRITRRAEAEITAPRQYREPRSGFYTPSAQRKRASAYTPVPARARFATPMPVVKKKPDWVAVRSNDSVSKIAKRLYGSVNYEHMAIALYNANPKAFFSPNINALKAGQSLRVPERKDLNSLSAFAARAEFYRQNRDWKEHRVTPPPPEPQSATAVGETPIPVQKKLTLSAPADAALDLNALLLSDEINAAIKPLARIDALNEKMQSLQDRLNKMEEQMSGMQKMLLVKDKQLALLQSQQTHEANATVLPSWLTEFIHNIMPNFVENRSVMYMLVGLAELIGLGLLSFYATKKFKTKKIQLDRY